MIINNHNRKQLIDFLIQRWQLIIHFAALERVYMASCTFAANNNIPIPQKPIVMIPQACRQIKIIKQHIVSILPEAKFIDYSFEAQAPLDPKDFMEIFVADHYQCVEKVMEVMKKMQIE